MNRLREWFEEFAGRFGITFDGWETMIDPGVMNLCASSRSWRFPLNGILP